MWTEKVMDRIEAGGAPQLSQIAGRLAVSAKQRIRIKKRKKRILTVGKDVDK